MFRNLKTLGLFCSPRTSTEFPLVPDLPWEVQIKEQFNKSPYEKEHVYSPRKISPITLSQSFVLLLLLSMSAEHHRISPTLSFLSCTNVQWPSTEWHETSTVLATKWKGYVKEELIAELWEISPAETEINFLNPNHLFPTNNISMLWANFKSCLVVCSSHKSQWFNNEKVSVLKWPPSHQPQRTSF